MGKGEGAEETPGTRSHRAQTPSLPQALTTAAISCTRDLPRGLGALVTLAQLPQAEPIGRLWLGVLLRRGPRRGPGSCSGKWGESGAASTQSPRTHSCCRGCLSLNCWGSLFLAGPNLSVEPLAGPRLRELTPERQAEWTPPFFPQPRWEHARKQQREESQRGLLSPLRARMAAAQTQQSGEGNMSGKIPLRTSRGFVREEAGEGTLRGALEGPGSAMRSMAATAAAAAPPPGRSPGPWPRAAPAPSQDPRPRNPRPRTRTEPATARLGGRGFESGRAYQVFPESPRGQVHVRPLDCPRSRRGQAERVRDRRRPGPTPRPAFGAPLSPWPYDPNFPPSRGAGSFRASRALGSVSAATSELGNKEGKQARRGEERKKYCGEGAGYLEIPQPEILPRSCLGLFFSEGVNNHHSALEGAPLPSLWSWCSGTLLGHLCVL